MADIFSFFVPFRFPSVTDTVILAVRFANFTVL